MSLNSSKHRGLGRGQPVSEENAVTIQTSENADSQVVNMHTTRDDASSRGRFNNGNLGVTVEEGREVR